MKRDIDAEAAKDPDQLERELDVQRAQIDETLRALEQRFSPGQIFDQVMRYTRSNSGDFSRNLVTTIKENPIPALLTATGLVWLMSGGQSRSGSTDAAGYPQASASYGVDPSYQAGSGNSRSQALKAKGQHLREEASGTGTKAKERLHQMSDSAHQVGNQSRAQLQHAKQNMLNRAHQANDGFERMLHEQPLALGAMGIALGAIIGAALPRTRQEDELMGARRDQLAQQASGKAKEAYDKAGDVGRRVAEDAKQDIKESGQQQMPH